MKKIFIIYFTVFLFSVFVSPTFAQSNDVTKVETFMKSVIQVLVTLSGITAAGFFVWGGFGYITSSGNPEALDRSKKTLWYSAIGLTVVLASFVLSNIVADLATNAFGAAQ